MPTFTKTITAQFETIGRRQKLVGQLGELRDEGGILIHSQFYSTAPQAETKIDALTHELLIDYAERGWADTLPTLICTPPVDIPDEDPPTEGGPPPPEWRTAAQMAQSLANVTCVPTHVIKQGDSYLVQDDTDIACYGGRADVVASYQPQAVTLTSIAIDRALERNRICANCGEPHYTWACPEVARASTPMTAVELGASLCGMLWCDPAGFVRLLTRSTPARRAAYAAAYIAFLRSERGWCDMTIADVLARWLPSDRGPAAPAMQEAA